MASAAWRWFAGRRKAARGRGRHALGAELRC